MDQDLKDTIKKLEEAKSKQEKIERIIILLSGLLIVIIFSIIGINIYSDKEETVSEPEINIVAKDKPQKKDEEKKQEKQKELITQQEQPPKQISKEKKENISSTNKNKETPLKKEEKNKNTTQAIKSQKKTVPSFRSGYYIQAGAFTTRKKAQKLLETLKIPNAKIRKEGQLYKVLIGEFKNRKEAYNFMKKIGIKGFIRKI
ncbi:SPOR domain-containing protein [Persephonella sp.]